MFIDVPEKNIEVSEIIKNVRNSELKYKNLRNRIKVEFNNGRSVQTVNLNLRALEKEVRRLVNERGDLMRTGAYSSNDRAISLIDERIEELSMQISA